MPWTSAHRKCPIIFHIDILNKGIAAEHKQIVYYIVPIIIVFLMVVYDNFI